MADYKDTVHLYGPLSGTRVTMPAADADAAIADGWAYDPYIPREAADEVATWEESHALNEKAAIAVAKLRGEDHFEPTGKSKTRDMQAGSGGTYQTRSAEAEPEKRGPGRPRKTED